MTDNSSEARLLQRVEAFKTAEEDMFAAEIACRQAHYSVQMALAQSEIGGEAHELSCRFRRGDSHRGSRRSLRVFRGGETEGERTVCKTISVLGSTKAI